jgi:predicted  nucleic acid-binding Zn-ribbon protein
MSIATQLYRLQVIDLAIAQKRKRIQEIDTLLSSDERILAARQSLDAAEKVLKPWQTRARDLDLEIKSIAQKIKLTDDNLYSGKVKNPKEMAEMQEEIAALQRHQRQLEDELLEAMMKTDEGQDEVAAAQQSLTDTQSEQVSAHAELHAEKQQLEAELVGLETQRAAGAAAIDATSLKAYEALRPRKAGRAVALLKGNSCSACAIQQTTMMVQQVQMGKGLIYCASCGRILAESV